MNRTVKRVSFFLATLFLPWLAYAQTQPPAQSLSLDECISYAIANQPAVEQARLDEAIGDREIRAELSGWMPQLSAVYNLTHNFKLQTTAFGDQLIQIGRKNNSNILLQANQTLYSNELFFASRAARFTRQSLDLNTIDQKINTVVEVSKAFYDVLLTQEQLQILDENIVRQVKQYDDALSRYEVGLVDKTDYQRASITLANIRADRKRTYESIKAKKAYLKQLMGLPPETALDLAFENNLMEQEITMDTTEHADFSNRVELQQIQTQQQLLHLNTRYFRSGFLPVVSAFANYNWLYLENDFSELYNQSYPTSQAGLSVALPIFQGTRRLQHIKIAQLREHRLDVEARNVRSIIHTQYQSALANYKSDYNEYLTLRRNAEVAEEVYNILKLQYDEGIKTYLDLIMAETDLRTAQINYFNALYRVLASKLDLEQALGTININR